MWAVVRRAVRRIGHRGALLILLGAIALLYGMSLITTPPPSPTPGLHLLLEWMPLRGWGVTLAAAGAVAVVCAPVGQGADWPGFAALTLVWLPWSLSFFVSWWPQGTNSRGWVSGLVFISFALIPAVCATWTEPQRARSTR